MSGQPTQVYLVTSGEYSNYRVAAVYLDPDLAEAHVAMMIPGDHGGMRVYPIRTVLPVKAVHVSRYFRKRLFLAGKDADDVYEYGPMLVFADQLREVDAHEDDANIVVEGFERERVDKVYGERVARWKATQEGIT